MAKKALLIGVSQYEAGLPPLAAAPKDVAAMLRVLQSPDLGAFDDVKTLIDPDLEAMQTAIDLLFQGCQKGDLGLLYFSGHGITDDSDRLYLATRRTSKDTFRSTAVSASFIHGIMRDRSYQRQHVLILDCCYSGAFAEGWLAKSVGINLKPQLEVEGSVVLTSSTSTQKSYEDKEGKLSLYTNYIVQGIESGAAESDGDGMISADELHEYAKRHVQSAKPAMKPEIYGIRQGIKIVLSRAKVDTKLEYRRLVERYAENGEISFVGQDILEVQRERWGLSDEVAIVIENEVLEPDHKRLKNLERYEKSLEKACKQEFPLNEKIIGQFKDLQEVLGLRDEDVQGIQERAIAPYAKEQEPTKMKFKNIPSIKQSLLVLVLVTSAVGLWFLLLQSPKTAKDFLDQGYVKQEKKDKQGALSAYSEAIRLNPEYIRAYSRRGVLLQEDLGEEEKAKFDFKKAITLEAKTADDYLGRGIAKLHLGDKDGAILDYTEAIRLQPDLAYAYNNRASVQQELGEPQRAIDDYTEAIRLKPDFAGAYVGRGKATVALGYKRGISQNLYTNILGDYSEAIRLKPDYGDAYNSRGMIKYQIKDYQGAISDYSQTILVEPDSPYPYRNRGVAKFALGDKQGAIDDFNKAINLKPDYELAYYNRGLVKKERSERQEALADFQKASELWQRQGNVELYNQSRDRIRELGG